MKSNLSRMIFLKITGLTVLVAIVTPFNQSVKAIEQRQTMPTKPFGKSGIKVPIPSFGGSLNTSMSPLLLRQAAKWGVTFYRWDRDKVVAQKQSKHLFCEMMEQKYRDHLFSMVDTIEYAYKMIDGKIRYAFVADKTTCN